jgi:hypothetical protein
MATTSTTIDGGSERSSSRSSQGRRLRTRSTLGSVASAFAAARLAREGNSTSTRQMRSVPTTDMASSFPE